MKERRPLQRGDMVRLTAHGTTKNAMVGLASPNGRSLIMLFDGGLFWPGTEGGYLGTMPLSYEGTRYIELINQRPVGIEPLDENLEILIGPEVPLP